MSTELERSRQRTRRELLAGSGLLGLGAAVVAPRLGAVEPGPASLSTTTQSSEASVSLIKPPRLSPGDKVGLISPATAAFETMPIEILTESLESLGLEVVRGDNYFNRRGYFAGSDQERAADINGFFADPEIKMLMARGGWGSARLLPLLDYDVIRRNPKALVGYSDVTALLIGLHARTGLVTFHAPPPRHRYSAEHLEGLLFDAETPELRNPVQVDDDQTVQTRDRIQTIRPGKARGRLVGGNLTVLTAIMGSRYLPDWRGRILFLEDVNEAVYRVDRMFTQLKLAGVLDEIAGFVFGRCTECDPDSSFGSLTLEEVLRDHVEPLGIPAWQGSMIGHIDRQFTLPLGIEAEIDAEAGSIRLLEPAVV